MSYEDRMFGGEAEYEDCTSCGGKLALTDVEAHYSGKCAHCRKDKYRMRKLKEEGWKGKHIRGTKKTRAYWVKKEGEKGGYPF